MSMVWDQLLCTECLGIENQERAYTDRRHPFEQDADIITFSNAFRRLGRKTQVHPFKESGDISLYVVNATPSGVFDNEACTNATDEQLNIQLKNILYEMFTAYHQTLPVEVYRKFANTVRIFTEILLHEKNDKQRQIRFNAER